jgi:peptidoglycan/xylan/chitin deacetylase (PgdA/CDA1 family)
LSDYIPAEVSKASDFILAEVNPDDTFSSMAATYLNDSSKGWMISEFNDLETLVPGQEVAIPLRPFKMGGLDVTGYQVVPVLSYHRISEEKSTKTVVRRADFEQQMKYLKENGYHVITLDQFLDFIEFKDQIPEKSVVLTFDDGWRSFYTVAFPILQKYGFASTLFVYTDFIGGNVALSWDQITELHRNGVDIQCHTKTHRNLAELKKDESFREYFESVKEEITCSTQLIETKLNKQCRYLAYPYGETSPLVISFLKKSGYRAAFTADRGSNPFFVNNFEIHRAMIYGDCDLEDFKGNLVTYNESAPDEQGGDLKKALLELKITAGLNPGEPEISERIGQIEGRIEAEALQHFQQGVADYDNGALENARQHFLIALRYNPDLEGAIDYLKNRMYEYDDMTYTVEEGDSLGDISQKIYKDPGMDFLIAYFNDLDKQAAPAAGTVLKLPVVEEELAEPFPDLEQELEKARELWTAEKYAEVIPIAAMILACDPGNKRAYELENASYVELGKKLLSQNKYLESYDMYREVDPGYEEGQTAIAEVKKYMAAQADEYFKQGVKYFVDEELINAIDAWEKTLALNPDHERAKQDIENARLLLEKLEQVR